MGPAFLKRIQVDTGAHTVTIARAYVVAREVCQAREIWHTIEALDNKIPATLQHEMMFDVSRILRHACYWLIDRYGDDLDIVEAVDHLKNGMATIYARASSIVTGALKERQRNATEEYVRNGVPEKLAKKMAGLLLTRGALDIVDLAIMHKKDNVQTAAMYAELSDRLGIIWMNRCVEVLEVEGRWQAIARSNLRDEFYRIRRDIVIDVLSAQARGTPMERFKRWMERNALAIRKFDAILAEMRLKNDIDFATLSVASQELRKLSDAE
jgi:glutamate dehydrogenase